MTSQINEMQLKQTVLHAGSLRLDLSSQVGAEITVEWVFSLLSCTAGIFTFYKLIEVKCLKLLWCLFLQRIDKIILNKYA